MELNNYMVHFQYSQETVLPKVQGIDAYNNNFERKKIKQFRKS